MQTESQEEELVYWRTLAMERGRALDVLRQRLQVSLSVVSWNHFVPLADALAGRSIGWIREPERMEENEALLETDVFTTLHELWKRVVTDGGR